MRKTIIIGITAICISSCGSLKPNYKTYSRPEVKTDSLFGKDMANKEVEDSDTTSLATLPWQELFTDPQLQALIDTGLANNSDLRIAELRVKEAEASFKAARQVFLPSVSASPTGQLGEFNGGSISKVYQLAVSANWELDIAGRLTYDKRAAEASVKANHDYRQAVQTQLVATIANGYYNLLTLDAQVDVSKLTLKNWDETIRTLEVQKTVGESDEAAITQAKANRMEVEGNILTLQQQIREQENTLCTLIGDAPHPIDRSTLEAQTFPEHMSVGVPLQLLDNRPDVRQAEHTLERAFYVTNEARAAFYPQATLSGTLGWSNSNGGMIVNPGKWLWNALAQVTQPIFNRGKNRANLEIAQAQQEEALTSYQQSLLQAGAEVNNALSQWQTAQKRLEVDKKQIESLKKTVKCTKLLLKYSDEKTYLEVLTAQQSLLSAELAEKQDIFNKIQGIINLYHALGGGAD